MPIEALGFFMESNFVKHRKGEFNGKREIFCPRWSFLQRAKRKQLAKYCGQDFCPRWSFLQRAKRKQIAKYRG
ncbi:hypothetical protein GOQ04_08240 [Emticicia sp. ODNR4P]|nr:hypothetical protein [Emticicia sp. ODNR4P]